MVYFHIPENEFTTLNTVSCLDGALLPMAELTGTVAKLYT